MVLTLTELEEIFDSGRSVSSSCGCDGGDDESFEDVIVRIVKRRVDSAIDKKLVIDIEMIPESMTMEEFIKRIGQ